MSVRYFTFTSWSWSGVFAGVITSLIFQVLLVMAGLGFGLLSIDVPTADSAPQAVSWIVFTWWAVSGVISAFAGGWVAANFSDGFSAESRATHGLMAWAIATLVVIGAAAFATSNSVAGGLVGPSGTVMAQYRSLTTDARARPTQAQLETARRNLGVAMLGSLIALLVGAGAGVAGSQWMPEERARQARHA